VTAAEEVLARHVSPDGALTLRVQRTIENGRSLISMGFEESSWHFHPTAEEAMQIVDAVLADRVVILTSTREGENYTELLDDLDLAVGYKPGETSLRLRVWSREVSFEDVVDGKIARSSLDDLWNWRV
jgi:hypothetical protein